MPKHKLGVLNLYGHVITFINTNCLCQIKNKLKLKLSKSSKLHIILLKNHVLLLIQIEECYSLYSRHLISIKERVSLYPRPLNKLFMCQVIATNAVFRFIPRAASW